MRLAHLGPSGTYTEAVEARNALAILHLETASGADVSAAAMGIPGVDDQFFRVMREEVLAVVHAGAHNVQVSSPMP